MGLQPDVWVIQHPDRLYPVSGRWIVTTDHPDALATLQAAVRLLHERTDGTSTSDRQRTPVNLLVDAEWLRQQDMDSEAGALLDVLRRQGHRYRISIVPVAADSSEST
ncbi:hypothetical protein OHA25_60705 (plasmid) [Nonomuraea sp. NBC_00507]|uniref:hypothetical protein n=1 Tax=Nonomuraea sp. NBC_00507 TaxID=2976002 RepID=UPI002E17C954